MKAVSFYMDNIPDAVLKAQRSVFDHFDMELEQVKTTLTHGEAIDHYLHKNDWKDIAIFDIDCIPLKSHVLGRAKQYLAKGIVYAAAQKANHIPNSEIYTSPAFVCFTHEVWDKAGRPTFVDVTGYDVGGYFSEKARTVAPVSWLYPSSVEEPKWDLTNFMRFGLGTTYAGEVYHAFLSRMNNGERLINKCTEVVNG